MQSKACFIQLQSSNCRSQLGNIVCASHIEAEGIIFIGKDFPAILGYRKLSAAVDHRDTVPIGGIAKIGIPAFFLEIFPGIFSGTEVADDLPCIVRQKETANIVVVMGLIVMSCFGRQAQFSAGDYKHWEVGKYWQAEAL